MDINFHYAAMKVLSRHAGFSKGHSQTIAYASQFVDDATAHEKMALNVNPNVPGIRFDNGEFDPICTAHKDLDYLRSAMKRRSRLLVYACFHFVPSLQGAPGSAEFRRVKKGGKLATKLVQRALKALGAATTSDETTRALIRLGMALHSYADTWSHQRFSGYWDSENNDIGSLRFKEQNGKWRKVDLCSQFFSYAMPNIGHAEAGTLPDRSELTWKCDPPKRSAKGQDNSAEFLVAARKVLELLCTATGNGKPWDGLEQDLRDCFKTPADREQFKQNAGHQWQKKFSQLDFHYDDQTWLTSALRPKGGFFDLVGAALHIDPEDFQVVGGREYFHFHAAAKEQRATVLEAIRAADSNQ